MSKPSREKLSATHLDVERLLGPLDIDAVAAIMALSPMVREIEMAALHVAGQGDAVPERHQPHGTVLAIIELVTRDDEDERRDH